MSLCASIGPVLAKALCQYRAGTGAMASKMLDIDPICSRVRIFKLYILFKPSASDQSRRAVTCVVTRRDYAITPCDNNTFTR